MQTFLNFLDTVGHIDPRRRPYFLQWVKLCVEHMSQDGINSQLMNEFMLWLGSRITEYRQRLIFTVSRG